MLNRRRLEVERYISVILVTYIAPVSINNDKIVSVGSLSLSGIGLCSICQIYSRSPTNLHLSTPNQSGLLTCPHADASPSPKRYFFPFIQHFTELGLPEKI